jgi:hypothetical protein
MDIHRTFFEVVFWQYGCAGVDEVSSRPTGNAMAVRVLRPCVGRMIIAKSVTGEGDRRLPA